jgi:hypothetical protein
MGFFAAIAVAISLLLTAPGCGGKADKGAEEPVTKVPGEKGDPVSDKGKSWGGWRWKGKRDDCFFVHRNRCFSRLNDACAHAKCPLAKCKHDNGAPATITCKK